MLVISQEKDEEIVIVHKDRPEEEIIVRPSLNCYNRQWKRLCFSAGIKYSIFRRKRKRA